MRLAVRGILYILATPRKEKIEKYWQNCPGRPQYPVLWPIFTETYIVDLKKFKWKVMNEPCCRNKDQRLRYDVLVF